MVISLHHGYIPQHIVVAVLASASDLYEGKFEGIKSEIMQTIKSPDRWQGIRNE